MLCLYNNYVHTYCREGEESSYYYTIHNIYVVVGTNTLVPTRSDKRDVRNIYMYIYLYVSTCTIHDTEVKKVTVIL